jgi:hypothetical protein
VGSTRVHGYVLPERLLLVVGVRVGYYGTGGIMVKGGFIHRLIYPLLHH